MADFYAKMAAAVEKLLVKYGTAATLNRITPGTYDPATGASTPSSTAYAGRGAKFEYNQRDIDGTLIRQGDQRVYLSTVGMINPRSGDTLTIDSVTYAVIASRPLKPATTNVLFDVQCRGVQ